MWLRCVGVAAIAGTALWLAACTSQSKAPVVDHSMTGNAAEQRRSSPASYVVRPKDTLYSIAYRHELDYRALAAANGIEPPFLITPGQRIRLVESAPPQPLTTPSPAPPPERMEGATPVQIAPEGLSVETKPVPATEPTPSAPPAAHQAQPARQAQPVRKTQPARKAPAPPTPAVVQRPTQPAAIEPAAPPPSRRQTPAAKKAGWLPPVAVKPVRRFGAGSKGFDYELPATTRIRAAAAGVVVYAGPGIGGFRHLVIVKASEQHLIAYGVNVKPLLSEGDQVQAGTPVAEVQGDKKTAGRFHFEIRDRGKPVDPAPLIGA